MKRSRGSRITFACRLYPPEVGAASFRLRELAKALVRKGCRVQVLTTCPPGHLLAASGSDLGIEVSRWPVLRDRQGNVRGYLQYLSFDLPLFARLLMARRGDMYVCEPPPTTGFVVWIVCGLRRRPYAYFAADIWSDGAAATDAPRTVVAVLRILERWVLRHAAVVLAVSSDVAQRVDVLAGPIDNVVTVGNGIDTSIFHPDGPAVAESTPYFVYAGTMSEWQGCDIFIAALKVLLSRGGRARLIYIGQGSDVDRLRKIAEALEEGVVEFPGVLPPEETARWLRGAVAGLVSIRPDANYDYARPTKIYAASAVGVPVIFAGSGVASTLVNQEGLGWAVDYAADAVSEVMETAVERFSAGTPKGPPTIEHLSNWTERNASLRAKADVAASAILLAL